MRLLIIDKEGVDIYVKNRVLHLGEGHTLPLRLLDTIIIASKISLNHSTLIALGAEGISVIILHRSQGVILVPMESKNSEIKLAQYKAAIDPLSIASWLLRQKIQTHCRQLSLHGIALSEDSFIKSIESASSLDELLGIEGSFSRSYFQNYFKLFPRTLHKGRRSKNPPLDPLNAILSYLYTLIYYLISVRLIGYGLEPGIGYLHRPFRSHNALASDLMEIFRADINEWVFQLFDRGVLHQKDFSKRGSGVYLRHKPKQRLWADIKSFHRELEPRIDASITLLRRKICPSID